MAQAIWKGHLSFGLVSIPVNLFAAERRSDLHSIEIENFVPAKEINIAEKLVNAMSSKWNPKAYHDDYREVLMKLIEKKEKGIAVKVKSTTPKEGAKVIDFMSLLKKSIAAKKGKAAAKSHSHKKAA